MTNPVSGEGGSNLEWKKIDLEATDGLSGVSNSLAYRVAEIERHLHSGARWFETAAAGNYAAYFDDLNVS